MNTLSDVIIYLRRMIKSASNGVVSDNLLIDYINRFWLMDVDARMQLFDLKTTYQFQTQPGVDRYNMPLYSVQNQPATSGNNPINLFPVYQGFLAPVYANGVEMSFVTLKDVFFRNYPNVTYNLPNVAVGDGGTTYTFNVPIIGQANPNTNIFIQGLVRGHIDIAGIVATGNNVDPPLETAFNTSVPVTSVQSAFFVTSTDSTGANVVVADSGQMLASNVNYGLLMTPGKAPLGNTALPGAYSTTSNTVNYLTGEVTLTFPTAIPAGIPINVQCLYFASGLPRTLLYYNNTITLRAPPDRAYLIELDAYLTPAAFLNESQGVPFGYMSEYIARGAARKYLSDIGDLEQLNFYEPLFREQEMLVWKRSQRQFTSTRTPTLYSTGKSFGVQGSSPGGYL